MRPLVLNHVDWTRDSHAADIVDIEAHVGPSGDMVPDRRRGVEGIRVVLIEKVSTSSVPPAVMRVSLSDGEWGEAAPVPLQGRVRAPSVSPDGRFPFFLSGGDIYWVDMAVVLGLR